MEEILMKKQAKQNPFLKLIYFMFTFILLYACKLKNVFHDGIGQIWKASRVYT